MRRPAPFDTLVALDTSAPLPLLNSLTHLTYLSSTSPRIREILTTDGGLERLLEILQESALPRPPSPPADWYAMRGPTTAGILTQTQQNSLRHSLAFQCVVNIGVRGSESIRTRVVQSGTLDVVAQIMEVWLKGKGMSVASGPLGSQAAVDRAMREGYVPGHHRSRDASGRARTRSETEQRERDKERRARHEARHAEALAEAAHAVAGAAVASSSRNRSRGVPNDSVSPARHSMATAATSRSHATSHAPAPPARYLTMDVLQQSLLPEDEPTSAEAARMTIQQRATVIRINAVARLAGLDRQVLRRNLASGDTPQSQRLREYFETFGLDVSALEALNTPPTSPMAIPIARLAADRHARQIVLPRAASPAVSAPAEDASMSMDEDAVVGGEASEGSSSAPSRRGTITAANARSRLSAQVESMTPRPPSAPLPGPAFLTADPNNTSGSAPRSRSARHALADEIQAEDQDMESHSPLGQSASSSASGLSLLHEDRAPLANNTEASYFPAESSSAAQARARTMFEHRAGLLSSVPPADSANMSNASTPVGTPPNSGTMPDVPLRNMRDRSGTVTGTRTLLQPQPGREGNVTPLDPADPAQRPISRAGTEDEESADGEAMAEVDENQIGIVGDMDEDVLTTLDAMQRGMTNEIAAVDATAQAQAEVDLAMGAPPGAPGAAQTPRIPEMTPRQTLRQLQPTVTRDGTIIENRELNGPAVVIAAGAPRGFSDLNNLVNVMETTTTAGESTYNDDTILLCLQLLAYLSKYPHVRAAFHHPHRPMHPGVVIPDAEFLPERPRVCESTNIFSLVERFTFRASPPDPDLGRLPSDIQYWAGVIMRNACRKDDLHGGVRQCANMSCGRWETFPREFAKCRRCRKAKYCSKECQSKAWQEGHRFWCVPS